MLHQALRAENWIILSKSVYTTALLYPVIMGLIFNTKQGSLFVDTVEALFYAMGNLWLEFVIGSFVFILIEFPIKQLIHLSGIVD